jgi:hypothetical protein
MRWPARLLLAIGAISASASFWAFSAQRTVLDPTATRDLATALIDTGAVAESLSSQVAEQLERAVPADLAAHIPAGEVERIATSVVEDPRVAAAFAATIESAHEQLLRGDRQGDLAIDSGAINRALRDTVSEVDPTLGARIADSQPIQLTIDGTRLPSLRPVEDGVDTVLLAGALIAIMTFGLGVAIHPDPWRAVAIVGRRLAAIAVVPLVLYLVIPAALRGIGSDRTETLTPFADAYGSRTLPAAIALFVGGIALWVGGFVGQRSSRPATNAGAPSHAPGARRGGAVGRTRPMPTAEPGRTDLRL